MKIQHGPYHWVAVALVLAALLLTLSEVHGQSTGSSAVFEGLPAMAGADSGITQRGDGVKPARDRSMAKEQRSTVRVEDVDAVAELALARSRHGVSEIDTEASKPATR